MSLTITKRQIQSAVNNFVHSPVHTDRVICDFFSSLDTPKSLAAYILYNSGEHRQLLDLTVDPNHYLESQGDLLSLDYLVVNFLSKADFLDTSYDKKQRALDKFLSMEQQCKETNLRFKSDSELLNSEFATLLFVMRRKMDLILGDFSAEEFTDSPAWGPGVSTLIKGCDTSATRKFQSETGITNELYSHVKDILPLAYPGWLGRELLRDSSYTIQKGNTVTTVPKNSKTDRVIAIEPGFNLFFQKAIGSMVKRRLGRFGIDLTNQSRNQELSRIGSLTGNLATVDFSSASDTISKRLVEYILPERWFTVMNATRSKSGLLNDSPFMWEKFSSMGNGFTFELESLIFFAAALSCCEALGVVTKDVSVYGDDVIIPTAAYDLFSKFSAFLGFTVNPSKSFSTGLFRESCGAHWFRGIDIKPIFLKERLTHAFSVFKLANSVRRLGHRRNFNYGCDRRFLACWRSILQGLPATLRSLKVPEGYGDGGILSNFDEAVPTKQRNGYEGFLTRAAREQSISCSHDSHGLLISRLTNINGGLKSDSWYPESKQRFLSNLHGLSTNGYSNTEPLRGRTRRQVFLLSVQSWYNLGSWS